MLIDSTNGTHPTASLRVAVYQAADKPWLASSVESGGGVVAALGDATGLVWGEPSGSDELRSILEEFPNLGWVHLPWSAVDMFADQLDDNHIWLSTKGAFGRPVAEHALALALTLRHGFRRASSGAVARSLHGCRATILGGGGIAGALAPALASLGCNVDVVRRHPERPLGLTRVISPAGASASFERADLVFVACPLTAETSRYFDASRLEQLRSDACLVNVGRPGHVDVEAIVTWMDANPLSTFGSDCIDSLSPVSRHPLRTRLADRCILTPHVGVDPKLFVELAGKRIAENVRRIRLGLEPIGVVSTALGY
jgi:phosphoglycerate dehydrogenase-like enzyme